MQGLGELTPPQPLAFEQWKLRVHLSTPYILGLSLSVHRGLVSSTFPTRECPNLQMLKLLI